MNIVDQSNIKGPHDSLSMLAGFFAGIGVFLPLLGRAFDIYVSTRFLGIAASALSVLCAGLSRQKQNPPFLLALMYLAIMVSAIYHASDVQLDNIIPNNRSGDEYYETKAGYLVILWLGALVSALVLGIMCNAHSALVGVCISVQVCAVLQVVAVIVFQEYFISQTYITSKAFQAEQRFSTISYSTIAVCSVIISTFAFINLKVKQFAWVALLAALIVIELVVIILLRQRVHAAFIAIWALITPIIVLRNAKGWLMCAIGTLVIGGIVSILHYLGWIGETVVDYWMALAQGELLVTREDAWLFAWENASWKGHGLGAFAYHYPYYEYKYPHNIFLEVYFELGAFSLVILIATYVISVVNSIRLLIAINNPISQSLACCCLFVLSHYVKANDLPSFNLAIFICCCVSLIRLKCKPHTPRNNMEYVRNSPDHNG